MENKETSSSADMLMIVSGTSGSNGVPASAVLFLAAVFILFFSFLCSFPGSSTPASGTFAFSGGGGGGLGIASFFFLFCFPLL